MERNELLDLPAYGLRSDFLSPETMPKATVELALTKNRKLLLASVLAIVFFYCPPLYIAAKINGIIIIIEIINGFQIFFFLYFISVPIYLFQNN